MPTATAFVWSFPWTQFVGGWNAIMGMFSEPIAIASAIGVAFLIAGFVVSLIKGRGRRV